MSSEGAIEERGASVAPADVVCPNAFSIDVEDWFHILDCEGTPGLDRWDSLESRVGASTDHLIEVLSTAGVRATFFVLGWVAERHPGLVGRIAAAGHEVACHSHTHELVYEQGRARFREDTRRAKATIEDAAGRAVLGYRAPGFSITEATPWAFDELAAAGFAYDSSIFPAPRGHGGFDVDRIRPFRIEGPDGGSLWEFPMAYAALGPARIAFAGGGYLRLFPLWLVRALTRSLNRRGVPVTYYLHPREVDPDQPRLSLPLGRRFKYYVNLDGTEDKVRRLLGGRVGWPAREPYGERDPSSAFLPLEALVGALDAGRLAPDPPVSLCAA